MIYGLRSSPDTFSMLLPNGVVKVVRFGKQSWRHTWVKAEDDEGGKVAQCHSASYNSEAVVVSCGIVVPRKEPVTDQYQGCQLSMFNETYSIVPGMWTKEYILLKRDIVA